jgi:hypothetical protein
MHRRGDSGFTPTKLLGSVGSADNRSPTYRVLNHLDWMGYRASRHAVSGAGDVKHVQVISRDDPVQVNVDEVLTRRGAPMPDHERLYVRGGGGGS